MIGLQKCFRQKLAEGKKNQNKYRRISRQMFEDACKDCGIKASGELSDKEAARGWVRVISFKWLC